MKFIRIDSFIEYIEKNAKPETQDHIKELVSTFQDYYSEKMGNKIKKRNKKKPNFLYTFYKDKKMLHTNLTFNDLSVLLKEDHDIEWTYNDIYLACIRHETTSKENHNPYIRQRNLEKYNGIEIERIRN